MSERLPQSDVGVPASGAPGDGSGINTPEMSARTLKPKRRAVSSVDQLNNVIRTLEEAGRIRNEKNGRIMAKYNAERPYNPEKLKAEGLGWKSNFSTKPLANAIDKISPRLTKSAQSARYLTAASLPETVENGKMKTDKFRAAVTATVRAWPGWRPFLGEVAQETGLFGYTSVFWPDRFSWKPRHFRQDRFFVPDQTGQTPDTVQIYVARQELQIHELVQLIEDKAAAEAAGWDIEAAVEAINEAAPKSAVNTSSPYTEYRTYEDAIRESSVLFSLQQGSKLIELNHVLVAEADGKVSYYIVNNRGKKSLLRQQLDVYESMAEALQLFSYQQANGLLMGSKGVGRELYELAGALDRARNELVDRLFLSGKVWLRGPDRVLDRIKLSVVGNAVFVSDQVEVQSVRIDAGVDSSVALDSLLTSLMDQIAGGVTPKQLPGERVTAAQVNLYAAREEEKRDDLIERFLTQLADVITVIQRRLADPKVSDPDAVKFREELLRYMTEDELKQLAEQPALRTIADWTEQQSQAIVLFATEKRADPLYDQAKLAKYAASARISPEFAEDVVLPVNDPTQEAEQIQKQTLENIALEQGKAIPVSPRDNHRVHIAVLKEALGEFLPRLGENLQLVGAAQLFLQHYSDHIDAAVQGGAKESEFTVDRQQIAAAAEQLGQLMAGVEQQLAARQAEQVAAETAGAVPVAPAAPAAPSPAGI